MNLATEHGIRRADTTVRTRIIGEWCGGTLTWGVELYWIENGDEHYRRARTLTDRLETVCTFCQTVDRAMVSPAHADHHAASVQQQCRTAG